MINNTCTHGHEKRSHDLLIVFTRYPSPGRVKTRLIPALGTHGAARLQREMTRHLLKIARSLSPEVALEVFCEGGEVLDIQHLFGFDLRVQKQSGGDLGERMAEAFRSAFENGARRVVLVGTDCPSITSSILRKAFERLSTHDCVLGPAYDGGYYLVGLTRLELALFQDIAWGSEYVLTSTLARASETGTTVTFLERLPDIDRPEDLHVWHQALARANPRISVIIPTLNEETYIEKALGQLSCAVNVEAIVVDGGSEDGTALRASEWGARVISSSTGRALQMNEGARNSSAEILLFLHADTCLPAGFDRLIRAALADPRMVAGAFGLRFGEYGRALKVIEWGANLRSRYLQLPYGDQGIFLWSADFRSSGGFPHLPFMEDAVYFRRMRRYGRIVTLTEKVITSARRYELMGPFSACLINQCALIAFTRGADPEEMAWLYRSRAGLSHWLKMVRNSLLTRVKPTSNMRAKEGRTIRVE